MALNILLGLSIIGFLIGLAVRLSVWFSSTIPTTADPVSVKKRYGAASAAVAGTVFSSRFPIIIITFFKDHLFQKRIFDKSLLRWTAHTLIFIPFLFLLFSHGFGRAIPDAIFGNYEPTLNPFLFLRNIFGLMVLMGLCLAAYRRFALKPQRLKSDPQDWTALLLIATIIFTGMLFEGSKMSSYTVYQSMIEEYAVFDDEENGLALEAYWVSKNGLVSPNINQTPDAETVALGEEVHSESCIDCHSSNRSAFASYTASRVTRPIAVLFGDNGTLGLFRYLHIISFCVFIIWLPFSKMFHIVAAPVSLLINRVTNDEPPKDVANILNRQIIGLSACTHCGSCSVECSSSMFYESFDNDFILPSEKVRVLKDYAAGKAKDSGLLKRLQEGLYICTSCDRCTTVCPSGINLKEIFISARYSLLNDGSPEPSMLGHFSFPLALAEAFVDDHIKALKRVTALFKEQFQSLADLDTLSVLPSQNSGNESYKSCYSCQRCTNICPVVRSYENPVEALGMLPHQIMYSLGIGHKEPALASQMIWSCSTCYLCQEHCPNNVELTDIFYGLKNSAIKEIEAGASI